jgi:hypothetical protein
VRYRRTGWDGIFDLQEESRGLSQLLPTGVAVEKLTCEKSAEKRPRQEALQTTFSSRLDIFYPQNVF